MAGLTADGFDALRANAFLDSIRQEFNDSTGRTADYARDEILGNLTAIMADRLGTLSEATQALYDSRNPNNAIGIMLTNLSLTVGVARREATRSRSTVTLAGTPGTFVAQGKQAEGGGDNDAAIWQLIEDATIGGGGTVDVVIEAVDAGEIIATAGTIDSIRTPVPGWDSVTNAADAIPGEARENDDELRLRRQQSLQISGSTAANALRANLLALLDEGGAPVLLAVSVLENDDNVPLVVEGNIIDPHSVLVIVHPSTITADEKQQVATTIYNLLAIGISTSGSDVVANVVGLDQLDKTITFDLVDLIDVDATITLTMESAQPGATAPPVFADVLPLVEAAVTDYFLTLAPGDDVLALSLLGLIGDINGIRDALIEFTSPVSSFVAVDILVNQLGDEGTFAVVEAP